MREKPAAVIAAVVLARHAAGYVRTGGGDGKCGADERRSSAGQAKGEASVEKVVDARPEEAEDERQRQVEARLIRERLVTSQGCDWGSTPRGLEFYCPTPP